MLNGVYWRLCTGSPWAADILPQTMAIAACGHGKREPAGDLGENIGEGAYQANSLLEIIGVPGSTKVRTGLFILGGQPTVQPTATTRSSFHQLSEADFWAAQQRYGDGAGVWRSAPACRTMGPCTIFNVGAAGTPARFGSCADCLRYGTNGRSPQKRPTRRSARPRLFPYCSLWGTSSRARPRRPVSGT